MKIDLKKEFDSVYWGFIKDLLGCLRFPPIFIKWITAYLTTISFTINLNGGTAGTFKVDEGLDKGIPYPPSYLF